ncbi:MULTISPECIES: PAS domain-containing protein [Rhizobium/Agrobacterium group]|uniref:PAS domain-containing protein n=1 Tax=Rhizobium/Agrobacterium group TaxID=227290 RepID=UPI0018D2723A|nr:PAS domain-containing protein [Agrobacterium vitis]
MNDIDKNLFDEASDDRTPPSFLVGGGASGKLIRSRNWAETPFGDPETWPQSLRSAVSICLGTNFPIAIYWGPELALLYNDAWSDIPGEKHPWALGRPGREVWPEIWDTIGPLFEKVLSTGEGVWQQDQLLPMHRHGYTEECYFNFTFSPIRGENGGSEGIFNAVVETTFQVIGERRERALRELAEHLATARSEQDVLSAALSMLGSKVEDVPFCALFMAADDGSTQRLVGTAGSEVDGNKLLPLGNSTDPRPFVVEDLAEVLGRKTPSQAWPEPVDRALAVPFGTVVRLTQSSFHHPLQRRFRSRIFSHCQHGRR